MPISAEASFSRPENEDSSTFEFDKTKISDAICKAIVEVDGFLADDTKQLAYDIADRIAERTNENLSIEQIRTS